MIENVNDSTSVLQDFPRYIGVGSVNILAVNPDNKKLASLGWTIQDGAQEPQYVYVNEQGKKSARVRFMLQLEEIDTKPIVPIDFWISEDLILSQPKDGEEQKCRVIDYFCRTANVTKAELKSHAIPTKDNGDKVAISPDYRICHRGEESILLFLKKWLNMDDFEIFRAGGWVPAEKPGKLSIDNWKSLCNGDVSEVNDIIAAKPDNRCKVIFGVRTEDDNKMYQTFFPFFFLANPVRPGAGGEYSQVKKKLDYFYKNPRNASQLFEAYPVHEYRVKPTEVMESDDSSIFPDSLDDLPAF